MGNMVEETFYSERNWQESALDTGIGGSTNVKWEPEDHIQTDQSENGTTNAITTPENTCEGICYEVSDEDTNTATYHLTSFNMRDIRVQAQNGLDRYTFSGSSDVIWEPKVDTQTEQSENGTTNDITASVGRADGKWWDRAETLVKENIACTKQSENGTTNDITTPNSDCVKKTFGDVFTLVKDNAPESMWLFLNARVQLETNGMSNKRTAKKKGMTKHIATKWTPKRRGIFIGRYLIWTLLCTTSVAALPRPPGDNHMSLPLSEQMKIERQQNMYYQDDNCRPDISAKTLSEDAFQQIECETSTCTNVSRIVFEKTGVLSTVWIPVFEFYNKSYYQALDTNSEYTLKNRALFNAFGTKHLLNIQPLRLDDRGTWRCIVYETHNTSYTSMTPLEVASIYVIPKNGNFNIRRQQTEIVTGQPAKFTCEVDGIFPKPEVMWEVNGIQPLKGITSSRERSDKLWSVKNMVNLSFDKKGLNIVTCSMKTEKRNPWIQQKITFDVKEAATILIPEKDRAVLLKDNTMVNLECVGTGYRPDIRWMKDGEDIHDNDSRYELKQLCNESMCIGYLKAQFIDPVLGCAQTKAYTGVYSCVISLKDPYDSTKMSPKYNVIMSDLTICSQVSKKHDVHVGLIIACIVISVVLVIVTVQLCILILVHIRHTAGIKFSGNEKEHTEMLNDDGSDT